MALSSSTIIGVGILAGVATLVSIRVEFLSPRARGAVLVAARYSPRRLCLRRSELQTHHQSPPAPGNGAVWSPHYAS